jgi:ParB-like chromosome segregation protein Spo0J
MNIKDLAVGRRDLFMLDPKILVMKPGFNLREEGPELDAYIEELALFIKDNGVPGVLTINMDGDDPCVIDGHCRTRAAIRAIVKHGAEIKSVPCKMMDKYASEVDRISHLITSNSGRQLTPIEKAGVVKRLRAFNLENKEIASKLGMTVSYVIQLAELAGAPEYVADMVKAGDISASTAMKEVKKNPKDAKERLQTAIKKAHKAGKKKVTKKNFAPAPEKPRKASLLRIKQMIETLVKDELIEVQEFVAFRIKQEKLGI